PPAPPPVPESLWSSTQTPSTQTPPRHRPLPPSGQSWPTPPPPEPPPMPAWPPPAPALPPPLAPTLHACNTHCWSAAHTAQAPEPALPHASSVSPALHTLLASQQPAWQLVASQLGLLAHPASTAMSNTSGANRS